MIALALALLAAAPPTDRAEQEAMRLRLDGLRRRADALPLCVRLIEHWAKGQPDKTDIAARAHAAYEEQQAARRDMSDLELGSAADRLARAEATCAALRKELAPVLGPVKIRQTNTLTGCRASVAVYAVGGTPAFTDVELKAEPAFTLQLPPGRHQIAVRAIYECPAARVVYQQHTVVEVQPATPVTVEVAARKDEGCIHVTGKSGAQSTCEATLETTKRTDEAAPREPAR